MLSKSTTISIESVPVPLTTTMPDPCVVVSVPSRHASGGTYAWNVERHPDDTQPMVSEDRERVGIARLFDEDRVAGLCEAGANEIQRLWGQLDRRDLSGSWAAAVGPQIVRAVTAGQLATAAAAVALAISSSARTMRTSSGLPLRPGRT
jgi:hypothetical protein